MDHFDAAGMNVRAPKSSQVGSELLLQVKKFKYLVQERG